MRRFFLTEVLSDKPVITGSDARHMLAVLRMKAGDKIIITDCRGQAASAVISSISESKVNLVTEELINTTKEPPITVRLAQGLPKGDKMEYIVQKAVELGVTEIVPWSAEHSVVRYDAKKARDRCERWQKIIHEAAKQCGRGIIPEVKPICDLQSLLDNTSKNDKIVVLYEGQAPLTLKKVLAGKETSFTLVVGPEGGFSADEIALCQKYDAHIVTMGPRILRTETAAIASLAALMYECGDLGG